MLTGNELTLQEASKHVGLGRNKLFNLLRKKKIITKDNVAKPEYIHDGYFKNELKQFNHPTLGAKLYTQTYVTPEGVHWIKQLVEKVICLPS